MLIDAVGRLDGRVSLVVAGRGDATLENELRRQAERLLPGRAEFVGWVSGDDKVGFLAGVDVLVMPSEYECFGVAAIEALAAGTPVIVSDRVGVADIVRDCRAGQVASTTVESITEALRRYLDDPEARHADATREAGGNLKRLVRSARRAPRERVRPSSQHAERTLNTIVTMILTLDEELHIERSVRSAVPLGPVFVVDCGSTDRTVDIARDAGATVVFHEWEGHARQKNWAIDHAPVDPTWLLFLDADEFLTPTLRSELKRAASRPEVDGYLLTSENIFLGRTLKRAYWHPRLLRMFRRGRGRWEERSVHEYAIVDGRVDVIKHVLPHENLKGIDAFLERHVRYARLEAEEMDRAAARGARPHSYERSPA